MRPLVILTGALSLFALGVSGLSAKSQRRVRRHVRHVRIPRIMFERYNSRTQGDWHPDEACVTAWPGKMVGSDVARKSSDLV